MTTVILLHGWGYDASLWDAVRALLPGSLRVGTLDFGFFGEERLKFGAGETAPMIDLAVGHSLGTLWWLTQTGIRWRKLLAINGFPRFTETAGFAPAIAPRVLDRMRQQFRRDPTMVLAEFHARCGGHAPAGTPDTERLAAALDGLAVWDGRAALAARRADVVALAGRHDPIVPATMSEMAFGEVELIDAAGHLLPATHPQECARRIERLVDA
ncbi:MAG: alpha/beta fold hydrolase [Rhodocyclaceae bacterium]